MPRTSRLRALLWALAVSTSGCGDGEPSRAPTSGGAPTRPVVRVGLPRAAGPAYVGSQACAPCHRQPTRRWTTSHHAKAMLPASPEAVLGDFEAEPFTCEGTTTQFRREGEGYVVRTPGPDGQVADFPVTHTFGWWPLQQFLVPLPGGRLQALDVAWDAREVSAGGARWFRLRPEEGPLPPGDLLHWASPYQGWNLMCAECHSTDLRKGWDEARERYETTAIEHGVGCEACHGPGERHVAWARALEADPAADLSEYGAQAGLTVRLADPTPHDWRLDLAAGIWKRVPVERSPAQVETCARCHARRATLAETDPGTPFLDAYLPSLLEEGLYYPDGQILDEVYEHQSFLQSKMYRRGVACSDCHGKHGSLAREGRAAQACANCHLNEKFADRAHHFHDPAGPGASCVACHMPTRTYMVVHARRDHSIRIPRPDLTRKLGVPNACEACHAEKGTAWAEEAYVRWWGRKRLDTPHWGEAIHAGREGAPGAEAALAGLLADPEVPGIARATGASLLGAWSSPAALEALRRARGDTDPLVRLGAAQAGRHLPLEARWWLLDELLEDARRAVRFEAARGLAVARAAAPSAARRARLDGVLEEYRASQARDGDWAQALGNLGNLALELGDRATAEAEYRLAVRRNPAFGPARVNLADLLRATGREEEGERELREGLVLSPRDASLHHALGLLLVRRQRRAEAMPHLEAAATLAPDETRFAYVYAVALDASPGGTDLARRTVEGALRRHPWNADALAFLADLARRMGDLPAARTAARRLVEAHPADPDALRLLRDLEAAR